MGLIRRTHQDVVVCIDASYLGGLSVIPEQSTLKQIARGAEGVQYVVVTGLLRIHVAAVFAARPSRVDLRLWRIAVALLWPLADVHIAPCLVRAYFNILRIRRRIDIDVG